MQTIINKSNVADFVFGDITIDVEQKVRESADKLPDGKTFEFPQVTVNCEYHLNGVTLQRIIEKAIDSFVIDQARVLREFGTAKMQALIGKKHVVKLVESAGRKPAAPKKAPKEITMDYFKSLDAAGRKALLDQMMQESDLI